MGARAGDELKLAQLLFPDLVRNVQAALDANGDGAGQATAAEATLAHAVQQLKSSSLGHAGFDAFEVPGHHSGTGAAVADAFDEVRRIMTWIGGSVPEPEAFLAAGVDASKLAIALSSDADLAIVPAPHGIGASGWRSLYRGAARQPGSPLSLAEPLVLAEEIAQSFATLDDVPDDVPTVASGESSEGTSGEVRWTLRLIPAGATPAVLGLSHLHGPHVTIAEMLMLQLMRMTRGADPLDARSFTWLNGVLSDGRFAARHVFDAGERNVRVTSREVGNQGPHLGARPPVG